MGEAATSSQEVQLGKKAADLINHGYFIQSSWLVTGEKASYTGVVPRRPFAPREGRWGAVELAARYSSLDIDPQALRLGFADPRGSAGEARELTFGLNWYFNELVKIQLNYQRTQFDRRILFGPTPLNRENVCLSRFQVAF